MNERRLPSIACLVVPMNRHLGFRRFMAGVLIGAAVLTAVFILV